MRRFWDVICHKMSALHLGDVSGDCVQNNRHMYGSNLYSGFKNSNNEEMESRRCINSEQTDSNLNGDTDHRELKNKTNKKNL